MNTIFGVQWDKTIGFSVDYTAEHLCLTASEDTYTLCGCKIPRAMNASFKARQQPLKALGATCKRCIAKARKMGVEFQDVADFSNKCDEAE